MSDNSFDALSKMAAKSVTRRQTLRGLGAVLGGALLATLGGKSAFAAAPQTCLRCTCGVGKPCNPKEQVCVRAKQFPNPAETCAASCEQAGFKFCGGVEQFHCPQPPAGCVQQ
jgi:hypothetical protein